MVSLAGKCLPAEDASAIHTVAAAIERKWKMQQDTCNWRWKEERKEETFPDQTQESSEKKKHEREEEGYFVHCHKPFLTTQH